MQSPQVNNSKLYVGNLPYTIDDAGLQELAAQFGEVVSARVIIDKMRNRSKGFGFVEFATEEAATAAIDGLNGFEIDGRALNVTVAKPMEDRKPSFGGGNRGGFGGNRGGSYGGGSRGGFGGGNRGGDRGGYASRDNDRRGGDRRSSY